MDLYPTEILEPKKQELESNFDMDQAKELKRFKKRNPDFALTNEQIEVLVVPDHHCN